MTRPKREREGRDSDAGGYPHAKRSRRDSFEEAEDDFARAQANLERKRRQRQPPQQETSTMSEAHDYTHVSADRPHRFEQHNERRHNVLSSRPSSSPHRRSSRHQATSNRRPMRQQHDDQRHDVATMSESGRPPSPRSSSPYRPSNQPQAASQGRHTGRHHDGHRHEVAINGRQPSRPSSDPYRPSNHPRPSQKSYCDSYVSQQTPARGQTQRSEDRDREIKPGPGSGPQHPSRGVYRDFAREGRDRPAPSRFDPPAQTRDQRHSHRPLSRGDEHDRGQSFQREPSTTSDRGQSQHPPRFTERPFQPPRQICDKPPFREKVKLNTEDAEKFVTHGRQSIDPPVELRCGNCGHRGHRLIDCIWPDLSGQISGCPLCNTKLHYLDQCTRRSQLSKAELYHLLVHRRGNRPAIASQTPWVDLVMEAATSSIKINDPRGGPFPWTKDFSKSQGHTWCKSANRSGPLWEFYDYRAGKEGRMPLPTDPKTKNLAKVLSSVEELRKTEVHHGLGQNALTL